MMKLRWPMLGAMVVCLSSQIGHADLLAHWDFEEGAGTTAADSVGSNNGTFQGTVDPEWVPSSPDLGTALAFNGRDAWQGDGNTLFINSTLGADEQFSVASWIYWDVEGFADQNVGNRRFATIASKNTQWNNDPALNAMGWKLVILSEQESAGWGEDDDGLYLERAALYGGSAPEAQSGTYGGGVKVASKTAELPPANEWVHVVATFDGTDTKFYFNGVEQAQDPRASDVNDHFYTPATVTPAMANSRFQVGSAFAGSNPVPTQGFDGALDEVRYYNHALTQGEIDALLSPGGLQADFDVDGDVDGADFLSWQRGYGSPYTGTDLVNWQGEYGSPAAAVGAVPEPSGIALLLSAFVVLGSARKGKSRAK